MSLGGKRSLQIASGTFAAFPSAERLRAAGRNAASPLRLELKPQIFSDITHLALTLVAKPIDFVRPNGKQTGYSVGCFEAHFTLKVAPGELRLNELPDVPIEFTGTVEDERQKGIEVRPKIEVKGSTEGAGGGVELGAYTRGSTSRKSATAKSRSDDPRTKCYILSAGSLVEWVMTPSPVLPDPPPLGHSVTVTGEGEWPDTRVGEVQVWGRRYVFTDGYAKLSGPIQMWAKLFHYVMSLNLYDDRRPERFEIAEAK